MSTSQTLNPYSRPYRPLLLFSLLFLLLSGWSLMLHQTNAAPSTEPVTSKRLPNSPFQLFFPLVIHNESGTITLVTMTPTPTNSSTVTNTVTPTNSSTVTNTVTPTSSSTVTNTVTPTSSSTVTNTATPTSSSTATSTVTSIPLSGTGIFKQDGETIYYEDEDAYTGGCGFIRFFDGSPAFGGEDGYRARFCLEREGCETSTPVDATGYFEIPVTDLRIEGAGYFQVLQGQNQVPVSAKVGFNSEGQGSLVRMDFIECTEGDDNEQCQFKPFSLAQSSEEISTEGTSLLSNRFCPSADSAD